MKRSLQFSYALILFTVAFLFSFDVDNYEKSVNSLATLTINDTDTPDLSTPYNYEDIEFPEHVLFGQWGMVDTTVLNTVTDEGATLGRLLFYDKRISALEDISCASCHAQEKSFADDEAFSQGVNLPTKRNSLQLNDLGWTNTSGFFWDFKQSTMQEMIVLPLTDDNEIGADMEDVVEKLEATEYYPQLFIDAFGDSEITEERIAEAITQFISSMVTFNSKRDKFLQGQDELNEQEMEGFHLFEQACAQCHFDGSSTIFIDIEPIMDPFMLGFFMNNGLAPDPDDKGMGEWAGPEFDNIFKVPTLRNIAQTGPYMHDGRFETLEDVVNHYSDEVEPNEWNSIPVPGFGFNEEQKAALVAFMKTMTDESFLTNPKWSDPFTNSATSTEDPIYLEEGIVVSPNPVLSFANVHLNNEIGENVNIRLVAANGQLIWSDNSQEETYSFSKNGLSPGMYFLNIQKKKSYATLKIIVQ